MPLWLKGLPGGLSLGLVLGALLAFSGFLDLRGLSLVVLGLRFTGLFFGGYSFLSGGLGNVVLKLHTFVQYICTFVKQMLRSQSLFQGVSN